MTTRTHVRKELKQCLHPCRFQDRAVFTLFIITQFLNLFNRRKLLSLFETVLQSDVAAQLQSQSVSIIREYLKEDEFGLAFDQILYEVFEHDIKITATLYEHIELLANLMEIESAKYEFIRELL